MTIRLSTGLRNAMLDNKAEVQHAMTADTISFDGDGGGSGGNDRILDSADGLAGFSVGDKITIVGSTSNNYTLEIMAVETDGSAIEVTAGTLSTEASGSQQIVLASARGGSLADLFRYGTIHIYSGTMPTDADTTESGTKLVEITQNSGAFTPGTETNGLLLGNVSSGVLAQETGETWSGVGLAGAGEGTTAGWFRFYTNAVSTGASTTAIRFDGNISTSGAAMNMSNTEIEEGGTTTIDSLSITQPAS
jgi:hypothetical protein